MGFDMSYQAIPAQSDLIERARRDPKFGETLPFVPHWMRQGPRSASRPWPEADELCRSLRELALQYPGLANRNCCLDRSWDILHYLLSAGRRNDPDSQDFILDIALFGDQEIADHVRAGQGVSVKYTAPSEVQLVAQTLQPITTDLLRFHYAPEKMEASQVYKFWAHRADEALWQSIATYFASFKTFYLAAAMHGEGVIVVLD